MLPSLYHAIGHRDPRLIPSSDGLNVQEYDTPLPSDHAWPLSDAKNSPSDELNASSDGPYWPSDDLDCQKFRLRISPTKALAHAPPPLGIRRQANPAFWAQRRIGLPRTWQNGCLGPVNPEQKVRRPGLGQYPFVPTIVGSLLC
jgi:hypothetical protein